MEFHLSIEVDRPVTEVFAFLADMRNHPQEEGSKVLLVEKTTPGPVGIGTRYREIVQMLPLLRVEMISEVTRYEPNQRVEITWHGGGMEGVLAYSFESHNGGTSLALHETVTPKGLMRLVEPVVRRSFGQTLVNRLHGVKRTLELRDEGASEAKV
jgi:uncharacterized protein YndB with AHSA1/START domain